MREKDYSRAADLIIDVDEKLRNAGRTIEASKWIDKYSPEGVILTAQKRFRREAEKTFDTDTTKKGKSVSGRRTMKKAEKVQKKIKKKVAEEVKEVGEVLIKETKPDKAKKKKPVKMKEMKEKPKTEDIKKKREVSEDVKPREPKTVEELLLTKLDNTYKKKKKFDTPEEEIIARELYKGALGKLKDVPKDKKITPAEVIGVISKKRQVAVEAVKAVKKKLQEQYKDEPLLLAKFDEYFEANKIEGATGKWRADRPPYTKATLDAVINKDLKEKGIKLSEVVDDWHQKGNQTVDDLANRLVKEAGLTGSEAQSVRNYVESRIKSMANDIRANKRSLKFESKEKARRKSLTQSIKELSNIKAFRHDIFKEKAFEVLGKLLRKDLKDKIDFDELVIKSKDTDFERIKYLQEISKDLDIEYKDALNVLRSAEKVFDEQLNKAIAKAKGQEKKKLLKLLGKTRVPSVNKKLDWRDRFSTAMLTGDKSALKGALVDAYGLGKMSDKLAQKIETHVDNFRKYDSMLTEKYDLPQYEFVPLTRIIAENDEKGMKKFTSSLGKYKDIITLSYKAQAELLKIEKLIQNELYKNLPASERVAGRYGAIFYNSMLLRMSTLRRNIEGNIFKAITEGVKMNISAGIDYIHTDVLNKLANSLFGVERRDRVYSFSSPEDLVDGLASTIRAFYQVGNDLVKGIDTNQLSRADSKWGFGRGDVTPGTNIFDKYMLNFTSRVMRAGLNIGDRPFYNSVGDAELRRIMKQKGVKKLNDVTEEMIEEATDRALRRIYANETALSEMTQMLQKSLNISPKTLKPTKFGPGNALLPFTRIVANIFEYNIRQTQAGNIIGSVADLVFKAVGEEDARRIIINGISTSLTSWGATVMYQRFYELGILTGPYARDAKRRGQQFATRFKPYALNFDKMIRWFKGETMEDLKTDRYTNFEHWEPGHNLARVAVDSYENEKRRRESGEEYTFWQAALEDFNTAVVGTLDKSFAQNLLLLGEGYDQEGYNIIRIMSSFIATPMSHYGDIKKAQDEYIKQVKGDTNLETIINSIKNRTGIKREDLEDSYDIWGRKRKNTAKFKKYLVASLSEKMYRKDLDFEIEKIIGSTGETKILPTNVSKQTDSYYFKDSKAYREFDIEYRSTLRRLYYNVALSKEFIELKDKYEAKEEIFSAINKNLVSAMKMKYAIKGKIISKKKSNWR